MLALHCIVGSGRLRLSECPEGMDMHMFDGIRSVHDEAMHMGLLGASSYLGVWMKVETGSRFGIYGLMGSVWVTDSGRDKGNERNESDRNRRRQTQTCTQTSILGSFLLIPVLSTATVLSLVDKRLGPTFLESHTKGKGSGGSAAATDAVYR